MRLRSLQILILALLIAAWYLLTKPGLLPNFYFEQDNRAAFFFGEPQKVFQVIVDWFGSGEIFGHLWITLLETALGFVIGSVFGLDEIMNAFRSDKPPFPLELEAAL